MSSEVTITSANFESEVINSETPVLVDFWAEWCVPCRMVAPVIEDLANSYAGRLKVGKVNVDEVGDIASRYNIISIPTLMVFKGGEVVEQQVGAGSRQAIENLIKKHL